MWNVISGNRVLDRKRKEEAHRKHINALHNIKSQIDTGAPPEYSFLYSRPKARQQRYEQQLNIFTQNSHLVQRMMKSGSTLRGKYESVLKDSLNQVARNKKERQIDSNNQQLVKRLQSAKSQYSVHGMSRAMKEYDQYKSNMAMSRMDAFYDMESSKGERSAMRNRPVSAKR